MSPCVGGPKGEAGELRFVAPRPSQLTQWDGLEGLRRAGVLCDVSLRSAGGESVQAHAVVLAVASKSLRQRLELEFSSRRKQASTGEPIEVMVEASADAIRAALDFIYGGSACVRPRVVPDLVRLARQWELSALQEALVSTLCADQALSPQIVTGLFALGAPFGEQLGAAARQIVLREFCACAEAEAFGKWKASVLEHLLRSGDLAVECEEEPLACLVRWCMAAKDRDSDVFPLAAIRWELLSLPTLEALADCSGPPGSLRATIAQRCAAAQAAHQGLKQAANMNLRKAYPGWWAGMGCAAKGFSVLAGHGASGKAGKEDFKPRAVCLHEGTVLFLDGRREPGRVIQWFLRAQSGRSIAGLGSDLAGDGADFEDIADVWSGPGDAFYVLDRDAERVVRIRSGEAEVLGSSGNVRLQRPCAVAVAEDRTIYVLDSDGTRVIRILHGRASVILGTGVAGSALNELNAGPTGRLFVSGGRVYISDTGNHRVLRWEPGTQEVVTVAGGSCGPAAHQLNHPGGLWVLGNGTLYVADTGNHRVVRWRDGGGFGVQVAGGCGPGDKVHQLREPVDVVMEPATGSLLVADLGNARVVRVAPPAPPSELVASLRK